MLADLIFRAWATCGALLVLNREWFYQVNLCLQICNHEIPKNGQFSDHATLSNFYYLEQSLVEMETRLLKGSEMKIVRLPVLSGLLLCFALKTRRKY